MQLIECIPNFSEGRDPQVIQAIASSLEAVPAVRLLHQTADPDHNRCVMTLAGPPESVLEAVFRGVQTAVHYIDLEQHKGVHPRLGAADVIPFVPLAGVSMADCVELSHRLGARIGTDLALPVYLYEQAATRPERRNLADVRRGGYEALKETIHRPERQPDYGPARLTAAGAVIVGARKPLIAFNVYLTTDDVTIARQIARVIRESGGGLKGVKALGLLVRGRAQVSMNLVDYRRTPPHQVVEMIRREAACYGTAIHSSELIGLIPQDAMLAAAAWYLQMADFDAGDVLENHLIAMQSGIRLTDFEL